MKVLPGESYPLGAVFDGSGTNFSLFSKIAEKVYLCLFDGKNREERIELPEVTGYRWHGYFPEVKPGQRYGYRVHGPWDPPSGHLCNPAKLLLDPYAKAIDGQVRWDEALFPCRAGGCPQIPCMKDSAPFMPRCIVYHSDFDWRGETRPRRQWHETVIYETHVKGFTALNPGIPRKIRGTYAGLAHPAAIDHLKRLGVTAVELMPVHQFIHDWRLVQMGLTNYWGYNSIGYFAPHNEYASDSSPGGGVAEFKEMVKTLHGEGIEVILDVVYNHTAEGNHLGPMLSFKGIDNAYYYRLQGDKRYYLDYTGTGNSLNMNPPHVLKLVMDSLRYWVQEMHVDGFRFDLAATLARELHEVDRLSTFFDIIHQDPVISRVKLIAEPWDLGEGGYQVGNFPALWTEWNGKYRDCIRDYWRGEEQTMGEFARRFTGSSDLYKDDSRRPHASINFITAHDGFTLEDLVSYNEKHNEANGEGNRDGENHNRSWNCGVEGPTSDPEILRLRARQKRNFLATLFLSQGVPMLSGGDEIGRTQKGNNNAYCQDNKISWYDWKKADGELLEFTSRLIQFRDAHPVFHRRNWFQDQPIHGSGVFDIAWFTLEGQQMDENDWGKGHVKSLGIFLNGSTIPNPNPRGEPVTDESFFLMLNGHSKQRIFRLPGPAWGSVWVKEFDTTSGWSEKEETSLAETMLELGPRSMILLRRKS
ncbi:MAG: glycogen debranching protein GlgX [Proteobacteria bacterium]|nr:glycogen debranching protein GlgX [Pseudomonadota bacterium]